MAESIHIKELNKGIRETVKGLREVTIKLTPLEEALPEVTQGIGKLEHGAEEAGSTLAESGKRFTKTEAVSSTHLQLSHLCWRAYISPIELPPFSPQRRNSFIQLT